jgi:hypothetical protein
MEKQGWEVEDFIHFSLLAFKGGKRDPEFSKLLPDRQILLR